MYYEEKMIDGVLHHGKEDDWKPFTIQQLSEIVVNTTLQLHEIYEISRSVQRLDPWHGPKSVNTKGENDV